jgi:CNT family concentrative nucleoside transporter
LGCRSQRRFDFQGDRGAGWTRLLVVVMSYLNFVSFLGIFGLCGVAWLFSENRKVIPWTVIGWGIGLQLVLGFLIFRVPVTRDLLDGLNSALNGLFAAAETGARFVFGPQLVPKVFGETPPLGYIFAVRALPTVVFFSGLMALLYNVGVIQPIVNLFARLFYRAARLSGAETFSGAANLFVGIEAVIAVRPFLLTMTRSELCTVLACCFGTASSASLALSVSALRPVFANSLGHLIAASIMAIPACFILAKIVVPETKMPLTAGGVPLEMDQDRGRGVMRTDESAPAQSSRDPLRDPQHREIALEAAIGGAIEGVKIAVSIAAVSILLLGLIAIANGILQFLGGLPSPIGDLFKVVTLTNMEGVLFFPLTLLTGVAWSDTWEASVTIGRRLLETDILPYQALADLRRSGAISDRTLLIVSYALSGFASVPAMGLFVGGLSAMIPRRRREVVALGWRGLFVGTLATLMIACVAGFYDDGSPDILGTPLEKAAPAIAPATPKATAPATPAVPAPAAPAPAVPPPR